MYKEGKAAFLVGLLIGVASTAVVGRFLFQKKFDNKIKKVIHPFPWADMVYECGFMHGHSSAKLEAQKIINNIPDNNLPSKSDLAKKFDDLPLTQRIV